MTDSQYTFSPTEDECTPEQWAAFAEADKIAEAAHALPKDEPDRAAKLLEARAQVDELRKISGPRHHNGVLSLSVPGMGFNRT